jgi:hypothetical protein
VLDERLAYSWRSARSDEELCAARIYPCTAMCAFVLLRLEPDQYIDDTGNTEIQRFSKRVKENGGYLREQPGIPLYVCIVSSMRDWIRLEPIRLLTKLDDTQLDTWRKHNGKPTVSVPLHVHPLRDWIDRSREPSSRFSDLVFNRCGGSCSCGPRSEKDGLLSNSEVYGAMHCISS